MSIMWNWTMSTFRNCHDNKNYRYIHVRMGGGQSRLLISPPFSARRYFPPLTLSGITSNPLFFGAKDAQLRRSFLNAVGFNWQKGPRYTGQPCIHLPRHLALLFSIIRSSTPLTRSDTLLTFGYFDVTLWDFVDSMRNSERKREAVKSFLLIEQPFSGLRFEDYPLIEPPCRFINVGRKCSRIYKFRSQVQEFKNYKSVHLVHTLLNHNRLYKEEWN